MMARAGTISRFERLRKGEAVEALVAEANAVGSPVIDPRTRRDDIKPQPKKVAQPAVEEAVAPAPVAVAEAVAEPVADEPVVDPVVDEPPTEGEAETPAE
jgi:hypothetical protein